MTKHNELIERLRKLAGWLNEEEWQISAEIAKDAANAIKALERENEALRKKTERYDYLTLQHGEFCITYANKSPWVIKAEAADSLIDAAKGAEDVQNT